MRLVPADAGVPDCSGGEARENEGGGGGAVVVVGVKLDSRSRELLTWALVKAARSGDRVIALHVVDPDADKSTLLSLVNAFHSVLSAYEGFCNLTQMDLKLKICRGSPVRKILTQEAKSCGAGSLIIGTPTDQISIQSRISLAKYCVKNLQRDVSVICVENGKIVFPRESRNSTEAVFRSLERWRLHKSPLSVPTQPVERDGSSKSGVLVRTQQKPHLKSGWASLRRVLLHGVGVSETSKKKSSIVQSLFKVSSRQCFAPIFPDKKQICASSTNNCHSILGAEKDALPLVKYEANCDAYSNKSLLEELKDISEKYSTKCQLFSYDELLFATNHFASGNLIGKGGSSRVYRGCLPGGTEIAVKILKTSGDLLKHFVSEIEIITSLHHKNIISLLGFCCEEDRLVLVYNLFSRGCLEENIHGALKSGNLCLLSRYKIALGVAEALNCLHCSTEPIIHRDVKSSNILLLDDFEPQLSDFGLATQASSSSQHIDTYDVAGTFGYLAPEYFMNGKLNEKVDIYAFGVVLLELLSGRRPIDNEHPKGQESLVMWAKHVLKDGKISELQDPKMVNACNCDQFERISLAAIICIRHSPQARPEMSTVLRVLQGDPEMIDWARKEINSSEDFNPNSSEQSATSIQSFINLALLNFDDDSTSNGSSEQNISMEDYIRGRWSDDSSCFG